jgi:hypothetical protein
MSRISTSMVDDIGAAIAPCQAVISVHSDTVIHRSANAHRPPFVTATIPLTSAR